MKRTRGAALALSAALGLGGLLACSAGGDPPAKRNVKVFLLAGQSNMDGRGDGGKLSEEDRARLAAVRGRVRIASNHREVAPLDTYVPAALFARRFGIERAFGPELFFGIAIAEAWPGQELLLIKRAHGGRSLYGAWNAEWTVAKAHHVREQNFPPLYADFIDYIDQVLADHEDDDVEICGMLWAQGESDSGVRFGSEPADRYEQHLRTLIDAIRRDVGRADLPFLILERGHGTVARAQRRVAATTPNVEFIPTSLDPASPHYTPSYGWPIGHINYEGMKRVGTVLAETYLREYDCGG